MYRAYRIVSAGVKVTYTGSASYNKGIIVAAQLPAHSLPVYYDGFTAPQLMASSSKAQVTSVRDGVYITWRPESSLDAVTWRSVEAYSGFDQFSLIEVDVPLLVACVYGAETNGQGYFHWEYTLNLECQYKLTPFTPGSRSLAGNSTVPEIWWYENGLAMARRYKQIMTVRGY